MKKYIILITVVLLWASAYQYIGARVYEANPQGTPAKLTDIGDVNAASPSDGQFLKWDNGTGKWIPGSGASGMATADFDDSLANYNIVKTGGKDIFDPDTLDAADAILLGNTLAWIDSTNIADGGISDDDLRFTVTSFAETILDDADAATTRTTIGLGNVENTALSTWAGTSNITTTGTMTSGTLSTGYVVNGATLVKGLIDETADADTDSCSGLVITMTVDTNSVGRGAALLLAADGHLDECDADAEATMPLFGLAVEAGTGSKKVLIQGTLKRADWSMTVGNLAYVSTTSGTITDTAPSGTGDIVEIIGQWIATDTVLLNKTAYVEVP